MARAAKRVGTSRACAGFSRDSNAAASAYAASAYAASAATTTLSPAQPQVHCTTPDATPDAPDIHMSSVWQ